ncbi:RHS repeat-associated core domain containing protein-containing protein [Actinobacteria bacterium OK074]|nr:RHS repeat-associated core domain containing protein-containing protein [Actinobacteria bacterium OK074]
MAYIDGHELHKATGAAVKATRPYTAAGTTVALREADGSTNGKLTWVLSDTQASTTILVSMAGVITRRRSTPFGKQRGTTALPSATDRGFLGKAEDDSTGLSLLGARMYDPSLGRFLSPDDLNKPYAPQETNAYSYAANNPVVYSDPSGLERGSKPNSCQYDLKYCDKETQDAVGYDPKTQKVDPTWGTAVGDGTIVSHAPHLKAAQEVYNWLSKDLAYLGTPYVTSFELNVWWGNASDDARKKWTTYMKCSSGGGSAGDCVDEAKNEGKGNAFTRFIHEHRSAIEIIGDIGQGVNYGSTLIAAGCVAVTMGACAAGPAEVLATVGKIGAGVSAVSAGLQAVDSCTYGTGADCVHDSWGAVTATAEIALPYVPMRGQALANRIQDVYTSGDTTSVLARATRWMFPD